MDPKRSFLDPPAMLAPGASSGVGSLRFPRPDDPPPRIDERLAPPETRLEYLNGVEIFANPADPPHAVEHSELTYVLRAPTAPGYRCAVDMLTRTSEASDIAPDCSIFPEAPDPVTGGRQLEELAFEVSSEQALSVPTIKARELTKRGVRRVFCILVKQRRILEWSREVDGWATVPANAVIEDKCLVTPLPVRALLDATAADESVVRALLAKHVPFLEQTLQQARAEGEAKGKAEGEAKGEAKGKAEGEAKGEAKGKAEAILEALETRGIAVDASLKSMVLACSDLAKLDRWFRRAMTMTEPASVILDG